MEKGKENKKQKVPKTELDFAKNSYKSYKICSVVFILLTINFLIVNYYSMAGVMVLISLAFGSLTFVYKKKIEELEKKY